MAQYAFKASNYDVGVSLPDLGFSEVNRVGAASIAVESSGGIKVFSQSFGGFSSANTAVVLDVTDGVTDYEVLLLCDTPVTPYVASKIQFCGAGRQSDNNFYGLSYSLQHSNSTYTKYPMVSTTVASTFTTISKNTAPPAGVYVKANAIGLRMSVVGNQIKSRIWSGTPGDILASEPTTWDFEATDSTLTSGKVGVAYRETQGLVYFTDLAIGTNGDAAILSPVQQSVATPTNVTITDITANSANVSWT